MAAFIVVDTSIVFIGIFVILVREEGVSSLYNGLKPAVLRHIGRRGLVKVIRIPVGSCYSHVMLSQCILVVESHSMSS